MNNRYFHSQASNGVTNELASLIRHTHEILGVFQRLAFYEHFNILVSLYCSLVLAGLLMPTTARLPDSIVRDEVLQKCLDTSNCCRTSSFFGGCKLLYRYAGFASLGNVSTNQSNANLSISTRLTESVRDQVRVLLFSLVRFI